MGSLESSRRLLMNEERHRWETHESHFLNAKVKIVDGTTHATTGEESIHAHGLPVTPTMDHIILINKNKAAAICFTKAPDATNIYIKSNAVSADFTMFILYEV